MAAYAWVPYAAAHAYERRAAELGVSRVARSRRGFMRQYEKAGGSTAMERRPVRGTPGAHRQTWGCEAAWVHCASSGLLSQNANRTEVACHDDVGLPSPSTTLTREYSLLCRYNRVLTTTLHQPHVHQEKCATYTKHETYEFCRVGVGLTAYLRRLCCHIICFRFYILPIMPPAAGRSVVEAPGPRQ